MDGGKCYHNCTISCFRKKTCTPLTMSGLTNNWEIPCKNQVSNVSDQHYHNTDTRQSQR
jgi:hypothetical protein